MQEKDFTDRVRYALVGTGSRAVMYTDPIATRFRNDAELVALCDVNPARLSYHRDRLTHDFAYPDVPTFHADEFDHMIRKTAPDIVIVATVDAMHHAYIIRAMELGCDVVTEKPLTIDVDKCNAILESVCQTGCKVRVTFNYRWAPGATMIRKLLMEGTIGDIIHVDLDYKLNTSHGADYFRRWHRNKEMSGGLIVHKATHHFDLVNWWTNSVPETVFGMGRLAFYGSDNAHRRGVDVRYDRYSGNDTKDDPFAIDLHADDRLRRLYLDAEKYDGYVRDRNVFGEDITIEDTMSVLVRYRTGVVLNYSLNAYLPSEGFHVAISGTKGRIEYTETHPSKVIPGWENKDPNDTALNRQMQDEWKGKLKVCPLFGESFTLDIPKAEGRHGGADFLLQNQIFSPNCKPDPMGRDAGPFQGAASILIGIAANHSFQTGVPIRIHELCPSLGKVAYLSDLL